MNIAGVSFNKDPVNIGDAICNALDMVSDFGTKRIDLRAQIEDMVGYHLIFGGGGLVHSGSDAKLKWLTTFAKRLNPNHKFIAWGMGLNQHDRTDFVYPDYLREWDLVGMREWGNPYEYVPCPSCLNPAFGKVWPDGCKPAPNPIVVFEHHGTPIALNQFPKLNSAKRRDEFLGVLQFLASGAMVITNSWHGAYWSLLLGKQVVIWKPFSNRFYGFKPRVLFCDESNWRERVEDSVSPDPEYGEECRALNYCFANKAMACIKGVKPQPILCEDEHREIPDVVEKALEAVKYIKSQEGTPIRLAKTSSEAAS